MARTEAQAAPAPVGLLAAGQPVPLLGVTVEADVKDFASRVVMTQRYRNSETQPIEAVYVFPLEEGAAVCGFAAVIDGVHVEGQVQEREEAFERYDDALAAGHGAYLLDQERPDVFTASIGNVPPGKEVLVRITYVAELAVEGDDLRFALPTTVSPRYAPADDHKGVGRTPAEALNPPRAWTVPYGLDLTVRIESGSAIRAVESPSHPLRVELDGARAAVRLGARETALDRDFVLIVKRAEAHAPRAWVETDPRGRTVAMVAFQPRFEAAEAPSELVFVVDRSGSMDGTSIAEARNALQLCLRSLTEGTRFNVVGFGSRFEMLFPESRPYDEASLRAASAHVAGLKADMGGTEILAPLQKVLEAPVLPGRPRQVFVLTDGQVTNTDAVVKLVRRHADTTRVFTFGIGAGASHHLVRGMARAGGGAAEFIAPGERIEGKVLRQLGKALAPALTGLKVDWGRARVQSAPFHVPAVFAGGRVVVYGFVEDGALPGEVTLSARGPEGPVSFVAPVPSGAAPAGTLIATLAARATIRDLEEGSSPLHDRRGSLQDRARPDRVKDEIVRLGIEYGLCSAHTSFVAVETRERPVEGEAQLRRVPVALTSGWGNLASDVLSIHSMSAGGPPRAAAAPPPGVFRMARMVPRDHLEEAEASFDVARPVPQASYAAKAPGSAPAARPLDRLVSLQRADGAWDLTDALAQVLGRSLRDLEVKLGPQKKDPEAARALATALALRWLETSAHESESEWSLLAKKARKWLEKCRTRPPGGGTWMDLATATI